MGRPLTDLKPPIKNLDVQHEVAEVIDTPTVKESEVQDEEGRRYSMVIRPYKTLENKIDGALIALIDIHALKRSIAEATVVPEGEPVERAREVADHETKRAKNP